MSLVCPRHVGRGDEHNGHHAIFPRVYQLMQRPVLENETGEEHQDPECPEHGHRWNLSILTIAYPQPAEEQHRETVDGP